MQKQTEASHGCHKKVFPQVFKRFYWFRLASNEYVSLQAALSLIYYF